MIVSPMLFNFLLICYALFTLISLILFVYALFLAIKALKIYIKNNS